VFSFTVNQPGRVGARSSDDPRRRGARRARGIRSLNHRIAGLIDYLATLAERIHAWRSCLFCFVLGVSFAA
jgi:hypothetical protein